MMELLELLRRRAAEEDPVRVGLVGAGQMGQGLVRQMELMLGMEAVAVADVVRERATAAYATAGVPGGDILFAEDEETAAAAIEEGKRVAMTDAMLLTAIPNLDIVVEATGIPEIGAQVAWDAILNRKHMLQMNVEADATVGYVLRRMAEAAGVVYTLTIGDEPGAAMELYSFARALGFDVTCVGKGKNNPLNRSATPDSLAEEAARKDMNPKMLAGFVDGTKTMVEMTSLGNGIGFPPDVRGMHGPEATPDTLKDVFAPTTQGGVLESTGVVDFALGTVSPGVFLTFTTDRPEIIKDLAYMSMGEGPQYSLYRPYHLTSLETPISIGRAVLKQEATLATDRPPVAETVAVAKRDLRAGEEVDGLGGFTVYGIIETADTAAQEDLLPLGLAPGAVVIADVEEGTPLRYADVELDDSLAIVQLRRLQDRMLMED